MKTPILLTAILICFCILVLNGQPGTLRTNFADNGIFSLDKTNFDQIEDLAFLSDGSIISCGTSYNDIYEGVLIKTSKTGEIIWTKQVKLGDNASSTILYSVLARNDEIYVLAYHFNTSIDEVVIIKYDINGNLINDFGADGMAVAVHENGLLGFKVEIDSEGNLYVFGQTKEFSSNMIMDDAMVVKFKSNGQLDTSFGVNGISVIQGPSNRTAFKDAIIIDREIYAVGWYYNPDVAISKRVNGMIVKLKANGSLDLEFGNNGVISFLWPESGEMVDIVQHGDGHFVAGASVGYSLSDIIIFRYNLQGQLDMDFGTNGEHVINLGFRNDLAELLVHDDLGIYVCASINITPDFAVISLNSDASIETSFGNNGNTLINIKNSDYVRAGLLLPNGDILLGGGSEGDDNGDFTMVKLEGYPTCSASETSISIHGCESADFDGTIYNQSGTFNLVYQTLGGCDSTIHLTVNIKNNSQESINLSSCEPISVNAETYAVTGTYMQSLAAQNGCDSVLTVNITIDNESQETISLSDCEPIVVNGKTYIANGTYTQILVAQNGCDSILTLNITIDNESQETISLSDCEPIVVNGKTYIANGTYTQILVAQNGCDSILTLNIEIETLQASIAEDDNGMLVSESDANQYQWYNCATNANVPGEVSNTFTPTETGDYALIISSEMCADTSDCINVTISGTSDLIDLSTATLFPNPTESVLFIRGIDPFNISKINLFNISGINIPHNIQETRQGLKLDVNQLISGLYYVQLLDNVGNQKVLSFVKE